MLAYILRRLISVAPIALGVLLVTFLLFRVIGGNPAYRIAGKNATPAKIAQISHDRGYDQPYFLNFQNFPNQLFRAQFPRLARNILRGDFGESLTSKMRVSQLLRDGVWPSLCVTTPLFFLELILAVGLALLAAYFRETWMDRSLVVLAVMAMSISSLVYIMVAQYWLASEWRLLPVWGFEGPQYLVLPVLIGTVAGTGGTLRFYRTVMLDEMYQDYVRTAFAKGCRQRTVLFKHVLKNAMIPIITHTVITIPFLYTGNLLLETFFGIPGVGYLAVEAINSNDIPVVKATVMIGSIVYVFASLVTDICYALVDPRIKLR